MLLCLPRYVYVQMQHLLISLDFEMMVVGFLWQKNREAEMQAAQQRDAMKEQVADLQSQLHSALRRLEEQAANAAATISIQVCVSVVMQSLGWMYKLACMLLYVFSPGASNGGSFALRTVQALCSAQSSRAGSKSSFGIRAGSKGSRSRDCSVFPCTFNPLSSFNPRGGVIS